MLNSVIASPMVKYRGPFVLKMPGEAWFRLRLLHPLVGRPAFEELTTLSARALETPP